MTWSPTAIVSGGARERSGMMAVEVEAVGVGATGELEAGAGEAGAEVSIWASECGWKLDCARVMLSSGAVRTEFTSLRGSSCRV